MVSLKDILNKPFAGPEMRQKYERALGSFLVSFNAIDYHMRMVAKAILEHAGRTDMWENLKSDDFAKQVNYLRILVLLEPGFKDLPFQQMLDLNSFRNKVAHGHFDQDLFSDDYQLVGKTKLHEIAVAEITANATVAEDVTYEFQNALRHFFDDINGVEYPNSDED